MVRVGGGWDTFENYLDKHDPCRCKFHSSHYHQKLANSQSSLKLKQMPINEANNPYSVSCALQRHSPSNGGPSTLFNKSLLRKQSSPTNYNKPVDKNEVPACSLNSTSKLSHLNKLGCRTRRISSSASMSCLPQPTNPFSQSRFSSTGQNSHKK